MVKVDKKTGKKYINNMPVGRECYGTSPEGIAFRIMPLSQRDDAWYGDTFIGTEYALFVHSNGFWQQVSKWNMRYGSVVRQLKSRVLEGSIAFVVENS